MNNIGSSFNLSINDSTFIISSIVLASNKTVLSFCKSCVISIFSTSIILLVSIDSASLLFTDDLSLLSFEYKIILSLLVKFNDSESESFSVAENSVVFFSLLFNKLIFNLLIESF